MSWDVLIVDMPPDVAVSDMPHDFAPRPLGSRADLVAAIVAVLPTVDFSDPTWGSVETEQFSIEFNMGHADPVESVMLHVHGGDGAVVDVIADLLAHLDRHAVDLQTGDLFDPAEARASFADWRAFRDRVVGGPGQPAGAS